MRTARSSLLSLVLGVTLSGTAPAADLNALAGLIDVTTSFSNACLNEESTDTRGAVLVFVPTPAGVTYLKYILLNGDWFDFRVAELNQTGPRRFFVPGFREGDAPLQITFLSSSAVEVRYAMGQHSIVPRETLRQPGDPLPPPESYYCKGDPFHY